MMMFPTFAADAYADDRAAQHERTEKCERAWKAYRGGLAKPLKVKANGFDDNVQPPFAQTVVDVGVGFLFGKPPSWEVRDPAAGETPPAADAELDESPDEAWLEAALAANDAPALLLKLGIAGGVTGHAMLKVQPISPLTTPYPRVIVLDHATVDVAWEADDIDNVFRFVQRWRDIDRRTGRAVSRRQIIERADSGAFWTILDQQSPADGGRWVDVGREVWRFPFPPIVHCQNLPQPHEFWGLSDLEAPLVDLQRALSFLLSNLQKTVRLTAHPKPYGTGIDATKVDASPDAITGLPVGGTLDYMQADPFQAPSLELFRELKSALHEVSQIPEVATGKLDNVGQLSGLALQILYGPLLDKTARKRTLYGPLLERLGRALLAAGGRYTGQEVKIVWQDPLPRNTVEQRTIATLDAQLGVSKDTLLTQLGYNAQQEAEKRRQEAQDAIDAAQLAFDRGQGAQFGQTTPGGGSGTQDTPSGGATA